MFHYLFAFLALLLLFLHFSLFVHSLLFRFTIIALYGKGYLFKVFLLHLLCLIDDRLVAVKKLSDNLEPKSPQSGGNVVY